MSHLFSGIDRGTLALGIGIRILSSMTNDGIHPNARGLIESLLDTEAKLVPQHYEMPRKHRPACGAWGQMVSSKSAVTCPDCKKKIGR